ncbi:MAG: prephenate dehydratase [Thermosynechococcaceae cyanobacterium MS004]|nr:prephenate dehydratase [Thermosynechococcaceae cyanobacterium MS004]
MTLSIAHLGPIGTYAEQAALAYAQWWSGQTLQAAPQLIPFSSIAQTLHAVAEERVDIAIAPVENSIEGSVTMTLDTLWRVDNLKIRQAIALPIDHVLVAQSEDLSAIAHIYSHPQALGQCQRWLQQNLPDAELIPTNSTTEALKYIGGRAAAISSERAAQLYDFPILARSIQDYPDNTTRFLVVSRPDASVIIPTVRELPVYTSLAFSLVRNSPGALVKPLQIFAERHINLSRIESRPSKRSPGDYVFFVDAEVGLDTKPFEPVLRLLEDNTESLKVLGYYSILQITLPSNSIAQAV